MVARLLSEYHISLWFYDLRNVPGSRGTIVYLTGWCDNNSDTEDDPKAIIQNMLCCGNIKIYCAMRVWIERYSTLCSDGMIRLNGARMRWSAAARLLRGWVRIPPGAWIFFFCCECCVLSGRGLCDDLITLPEETYRLWCFDVCDLQTSWLRRPRPFVGPQCHRKKK